MEEGNENHEKIKNGIKEISKDAEERVEIEKNVDMMGSILPQTGLRKPSRQPRGLWRDLG